MTANASAWDDFETIGFEAEDVSTVPVPVEEGEHLFEIVEVKGNPVDMKTKQVFMENEDGTMTPYMYYYVDALVKWARVGHENQTIEERYEILRPDLFGLDEEDQQKFIAEQRRIFVHGRTKNIASSMPGFWFKKLTHFLHVIHDSVWDGTTIPANLLRPRYWIGKQARLTIGTFQNRPSINLFSHKSANAPLLKDAPLFKDSGVPSPPTRKPVRVVKKPGVLITEEHLNGTEDLPF